MWLIPKSISSHFARVLRASTRDSKSPCPEPGLFVQSSGKPIVRPFSWRGWSKRPWSRVLFGAAILRSSTVARGLVSWTSSLRATRDCVNRSPWLVSSVARTIHDTFGLTSLESLARFVPDTPFSKTYLGTLFSDSIPFSASFETWATELRRLSALRRKSVQATEGNGCSSSEWPTARAEDSESCGNHPNAVDSLTGATGMRQAVKPPGGGDTCRSGDRKGELLLGGKARAWATPKAEGNDNANSADAHVSLGKQANQWPTPNVPNRGPEGSKSHEHRLDRKYLDATAQSFHPSPPAPENSTSGGESSMSRPGLNPPSKRRLNVAFVEWLMNFPPRWSIAHSGCGHLETPRVASRQRMLLSSLLRNLSREK